MSISLDETMNPDQAIHEAIITTGGKRLIDTWNRDGSPINLIREDLPDLRRQLAEERFKEEEPDLTHSASYSEWKAERIKDQKEV